MIRLFRNKNVALTTGIFCVISAAGSLAAFVLDVRFGVATLALCAAFIIVFLIHSKRRLAAIAALSADVDAVLFNDVRISFGDCDEGELAVLKSKISKMVSRLWESRRRLRKDKTYLSDSIADISHQIRVPLTAVNIIVSRLSEPELASEKRLELTRELYGTLFRIERLINSLLKISRLDAGVVSFKSEETELSELINKAVSPLLIPIELREQKIKINASGNFFGDAVWSSEAITNVIKNCMEHTPKGGKIEITASENALFSQIVVSDSGSGIDLEDLPHIFERFYKGKSSGTDCFGVGLALARTIIASQGGTISARNNNGAGASFTIRFYKGTV